MSRQVLHTVDETLVQLFEDNRGEIPDHASDSEIEGDSDEEYNDIITFQGPVVAQSVVGNATSSHDIPSSSSSSTITTRQSKRTTNKRKPAKKIIQPPKRTRRTANIAFNDLDASLSALAASTADSSDGDNDIPNDNNQCDWRTTVASYFLTLPNFDEPTAPEVNHVFDDSSLPGEYFERFFDPTLICLLTQETNKYARQEQIKNWTETSVEEIRAFLGVMVVMGVIGLKQVDLYWSSDPFFETSRVRQVMTCKKFKKLLEAFHVNDNETAIPHGQVGYDKLHKVRPLIDGLNERFQHEYKHSNCQSIDESMILFKGRSTMKQYMPMKPIKRGYKVWVRADPVTGYMSQFEMYTGKPAQTEEFASDGLGTRVVKKLCQGINHDDYDAPILVVFDNFFTSFDLMKFLRTNNLFSVGTVRINKKELPPDMKKKQKMQRGEHKSFSKENVAAILWQDNRTVAMLTTAHNPDELITVSRTEKNGSKVNVSCPKAIKDYTAYMRGVDRFDQLKESYSVSRRSRKYWFRLFYFLLDAALVNAYVLFSVYNAGSRTSMKHIDFNKHVAEHLIGNFSSRKKNGFSSAYYMNKNYTANQKSIGVPPEIRFSNVGCHLPVELPAYRRCRLCSTAQHDKRSKISCTACKVPLCAVPCFAKFHTT